MAVLFWIITSTFLVSLISFVGISILFLKEKTLNRILLVLVAFAGGALLGGAFFHLLPEAISKVGIGEQSILKLFLYLIAGFCSFFVLENFINWHHHHSGAHPEIKSFSYLILVSDAFHNFIDGMVIAASFAVDFSLGAATTAVVTFHEIPKEIGSFGVLIYCGFGKFKALFWNFISALTAILGGITGFFLWEKIGSSIIFLLPFAAGNFIYIACSDLIPEIKSKENFKKSVIYFFVFLAGLALMFLLKLTTGD